MPVIYVTLLFFLVGLDREYRCTHINRSGTITGANVWHGNFEKCSHATQPCMTCNFAFTTAAISSVFFCAQKSSLLLQKNVLRTAVKHLAGCSALPQYISMPATVGPIKANKTYHPPAIHSILPIRIYIMFERAQRTNGVALHSMKRNVLCVPRYVCDPPGFTSLHTYCEHKILRIALHTNAASQPNRKPEQCAQHACNAFIT